MPFQCESFTVNIIKVMFSEMQTKKSRVVENNYCEQCDRNSLMVSETKKLSHEIL